MFSRGRFAECLINETARVPSKSGRKAYFFGKSYLCTLNRRNRQIFRVQKFVIGLKSSTIAAYVFSLWSIFMMGESSDMNCCIFTLLLS